MAPILASVRQISDASWGGVGVVGRMMMMMVCMGRLGRLIANYFTGKRSANVLGHLPFGTCVVPSWVVASTRSLYWPIRKKSKERD